jgi:hypothetical protein
MQPHQSAGESGVIELRRAQLNFGDKRIADEVKVFAKSGWIIPTKCLTMKRSQRSSMRLWASASPEPQYTRPQEHFRQSGVAFADLETRAQLDSPAFCKHFLLPPPTAF